MLAPASESGMNVSYVDLNQTISVPRAVYRCYNRKLKVSVLFTCTVGNPVITNIVPDFSRDKETLQEGSIECCSASCCLVNQLSDLSINKTGFGIEDEGGGASSEWSFWFFLGSLIILTLFWVSILIKYCTTANSDLVHILKSSTDPPFSSTRLGKDGTIHPLVQYNNYIKFKPKRKKEEILRMFKKGKHPRLPVSVSQIRSSELLEYEYELELGEEKILPDITFAGTLPKLTKAIRTSSISTIGSIQAESSSNNDTSTSMLGVSSRNHPEVLSSSTLEISSQNYSEESSRSMPEISSQNHPDILGSSMLEISSLNHPDALSDSNAEPGSSRPGIFSISTLNELPRRIQAEELPHSPVANPPNDHIDRTAEIPPAESAVSSGAATSDSTTFLNQFYQAYVFSGPAHLSAETMMRMLNHFRELRGDTETTPNLSEDMPRIDSRVDTSDDETDLKDEDLDADVESLSSGIIRPSFSSGKHRKTLPLDSSIKWSPQPLVPSYVPSYSVPSVWNIDNCREKLYRYTFLEGIIYPPGYIP